MASEGESDRIINRNWRVVRKIGQGGMGTVWEVRHKDVRRLRSAVKEIKAGLASNQEVVRRFLREVRLMAELEGVDHIVRVTEFDRHEGIVFMTLVDGPSLAQVIEEHGALPYEQVVRFGYQIATALGIVHERGIVHRDIKPPNILIDEKNQKAYLTDFGIAKKLDLSEGDETIDGTMTVEGTLTVDVQYMGTPRYSSPEQLRVEYPPHPLWDIYAMGVLLYEAYSGVRYLAQLKKYHEFLQSVGTNPAFEVDLHYPVAPPSGFAEIIEHCLQRDPTKRLSNANELAARLHRCEEDLHSGVAVVVPRREDLVDPRRNLREEIERRFTDLSEIEGTLVALGLNLPAGPAAETLSHFLHDISVIEGGGDYSEALGRLEALREQADAAQARALQVAREGLERRLAELEAERGDLERRAGRWLDAARLAAAGQGVSAARQALADQRWKAAGEALGGVQAQLREADEAARAAAQAAGMAVMAEVAEQAAAVRRLDANAVPQGFDAEAVRAQVDAQLAAGQIEAAVQQAEGARASIGAALDRVRERAAAQVREARAALEQRVNGLDLAAARAAAADELAQIERARRAAADAEAAGDLPAALSAFAAAADAASAAAERVGSVQAAERDALIEALSTLVDETADAPPPIVGEARAAAERLLAEPPAVHASAVAALRDAAARLSAAAAEAPAFAAATAQRVAAEAARAAATDLPLARADRRRAEAALSAAARAFDGRQWDAAATKYGEALAEWESLAAQARTRSQQEQCTALRDAAQAEVDALQPLEAERSALGVATDDAPAHAALRSALARVDEQIQGGAFDGALADLGALRESAAQARSAHEAALRGALTDAVQALSEQLAALDARAGALLPAAQRTAIEQVGARANAALAAGEWTAARSAVADARAAATRVETALQRDTETAVHERLAAIDGTRRLLADAGVAPALDLDALQARTTALLERGELAAARQAVEEAAAGLEAARVAHEREQQRRMEAARAALETTLRGLDVDAARAVAEAAVARGDQMRAAGAAAERRQAYGEASAAYEGATTAFGEAAAALDERQRLELVELGAAVRERLQALADAPAALADPARDAARAALESDTAPDRVAACQALRKAQAALDAAIADAPVFAEAARRRDEAEKVRQRLAELPVSSDELAAAEAALRAAAGASAQRAWAAARDQFAEATRALEALVRTGEERRRAEIELAAQRQAARGELTALVEHARQAPAEVVQTALQAAESLLGREESMPDDLRAGAAGLTSALAEVPSYVQASEARARADALQEKIAKRRFKRARLAPPRNQLRAARTAVGQRQWAVAAERYAEAAGQLAALDELPDDARSVVPFAAAGLLLALAGGAAWWFLAAQRPTPGENRVQVASAPVQPQPVAPAVQAPAPPVPPRIASMRPAGDTVTLNAGAVQSFAIELDPHDANADVHWLVGGQPVAAGPGLTTWDYRPDAAAAAQGQADVTVKVATGTADGQTHSWKIDFAHEAHAVNHLPQIVSAQPPQNQEVRKELGQSASFAVDVTDADDDPLRYQWSVDGQPVGANKPAVDVPVQHESETVALAISDGKQAEPLQLEWKITGVLGAQPASIKQLAFGDAETFKITPPAPATQIAWAVNGQKVSDGPTFVYHATDPALVGAAPVQVRAVASPPGGKPLAHEWNFTVTAPAAPKVTSTSPRAGAITAAAGAEQMLALTTAPPASGQQFTYVFTVNGRETRSETPRISVAPSDDGETTVVAAVEDNFRQRSRETRWTVAAPKQVAAVKPPAVPAVPAAPAASGEALVRGWLDQYRGALNGKDVATQCGLLQLDSGKCAQLGKALDAQENLRVAFDDVSIEPQADGRVRARYARVDEFVDPSGHSQSRRTQVTQTFRIANGKAQLDKSGQ
jgi:serine/threonine protein kinase